MTPSSAEIRKFAERVVELYVSRVSMTLLAQGELEREIAAHVRQVLAPGEAVDDWGPVANHVLDAWESRTQARGPRVASLSAITARVSEKKRAA